MAAQAVNLAFRHVEGWAPDWIVKPSMAESDLIVLQHAHSRRGAALVNRWAGVHEPTPVDFDALRTTRPLLARTRLDVADDGSATDRVRAIRPVAESVKGRSDHLSGCSAGLGKVPDPGYQGPTPPETHAGHNASKGYIMKARLFLLAVSVAPLAAMLGAARGRI